ncbi:hypothetical protein LCGC14_0400010 [marine sediment metagenome]|uniref:Recombination endonuclease VII n=1 Tax=marine sediment metagenome TaxID=412755 RepID=A0A0F9T2T0_9ZZZZ
MTYDDKAEEKKEERRRNWREKRRRYKKCHREQVRRYQHEWYEQNREKLRRRSRQQYLRANYGMTPEDYEQLLQAGNKRCWLCGTTEPGRNDKHFSVDHDHITGRIRGLLCFACNAGIIGRMEEREVTLKTLANYLKGKKACRILQMHS